MNFPIRRGSAILIRTSPSSTADLREVTLPPGRRLRRRTFQASRLARTSSRHQLEAGDGSPSEGGGFGVRSVLDNILRPLRGRAKARSCPSSSRLTHLFFITMTTATDSPLCVVCHDAIGDEPAIEASAYDGVAHQRCCTLLLNTDRQDA